MDILSLPSCKITFSESIILLSKSSIFNPFLLTVSTNQDPKESKRDLDSIKSLWSSLTKGLVDGKKNHMRYSETR